MRPARTPSALSSASSWSSASVSPETTTDAGPLTAARVTRSAELADALGELLGRERHGHHSALALDLRQSPAPGGDDQGSVFQREPAGDVGGGDLPLGVADHRGRLHPEGAPQGSQRDHHREQGGLHHVDGLERGLPRVAAQDPLEVPVDMRLEGRRAGPHPLCEDRGAVEQLDRHPGPLAALAGEDEHRRSPTRPLDDAFDEARRRIALREARETLEQILAALADDDRSLVQSAARGSERPADVLGAKVMFGEVGHQARRPLAERGDGLRRQDEGHRDRAGARRPGIELLRTGGRFRSGLDHHVAVGSPEAEGADAGDSGQPLRPRLASRLYSQTQLIQRDRGVRSLEVEALRDLAVTESKDRLDQAGGAGGGLQMPDVRLRRADPHRRVLTVRPRAVFPAPPPRPGRRAASPCRAARRRTPRPALFRRSRRPSAAGDAVHPDRARSARPRRRRC